jgi:lipoate-protein ligase A
METIIAALITAAIDCFNIQLVLQPLSEEEWQHILATK